MPDDIRWIQRFNNYCKALDQLSKFIDKDDLSELEKQGLIQSFEYNYELAWNTVKDYLEYQGINDVIGSRDAFRIAFKRGLLQNGEVWMRMIKSRALTSHTYNQEIADKVTEAIINVYYDEFVALKDRLTLLKSSF